MQLYVCCGHGAGDPGACSGGHSEADLVRRLGRRIKELGGSNVVLLDPDRNWYASQGFKSLSVPKGSPVVELHMDSATASARGGHVIYKAGFAPDRWDRALADVIASVFPGRASRLVGRTNLRNCNQCATRGINYRLVENGFISNAGDRATFINRLDGLAWAYLNVFELESCDGSVSVDEGANPDAEGLLEVDGLWGRGTTLRAQEVTGAPFKDGVVSRQNPAHRSILSACTTGWEWTGSEGKGSPLIGILQEMWGAKRDCVFGPDTANAMIEYYIARGSGATILDGKLDYKSKTVMAFQRDLNKGTI